MPDMAFQMEKETGLVQTTIMLQIGNGLVAPNDGGRKLQKEQIQRAAGEVC